MSKPILLVIAAVLAVTCGSSWAATTATGTLSTLGFELTDLDLDDGIAPSISFGNGISWTLNVYSANQQSGVRENFTIVDHFGFPPADLSASVGPATSFASVVGDPRQRTAGISTSIHADVAGFSTAAGSIFGQYVLSPNTRLTLMADVALHGAIDDDRQEEAVASYSLVLRATIGGTSQVGEAAIVKVIRKDAPGGSEAFLFEETMYVDLVNDTAQQVTGSLEAFIFAGGAGIPSPVPEPAMWVMVLAGLAPLTVFGRRRRSA